MPSPSKSCRHFWKFAHIISSDLMLTYYGRHSSLGLTLDFQHFSLSDTSNLVEISVRYESKKKEKVELPGFLRF